MKRGRNRSSSNSTLDMTPMLDVVFLVLFIVVMAYAKAGTSTIISETEYENKVSSYEYATEQYNKLLEKVELLTITCTYNTNYNRFRSVTILSDGEIEPKYQDSFEDSIEDSFEDNFDDVSRELRDGSFRKNIVY